MSESGVDQNTKAIFAVSGRAAILLWTPTDTCIWHEWVNIGPHMTDAMCGAIDDAELDAMEPGLYVWEGDVHWNGPGWAGSEPVDADISYYGKTRRATADELLTAGLLTTA